MQWVRETLIFFLLLSLAQEDLGELQISLYKLVLLGLLSCWQRYCRELIFPWFWLLYLGFFTLPLLGKKASLPTLLGCGDIFLLLALRPLFSLREFIHLLLLLSLICLVAGLVVLLTFLFCRKKRISDFKNLRFPFVPLIFLAYLLLRSFYSLSAVS